VISSGLETAPRPQGRLTDHIGLGVLAARFDRDLLEEVLNRTGRREKRSRRLPAQVMIRYVIAMGLFFTHVRLSSTARRRDTRRSRAQPSASRYFWRRC
jgi:hypothetical protein